MTAEILTHPASRLPAAHNDAGQCWLPPLWLWPESPYRGSWEWRNEPEYLVMTGRAASIGEASLMLCDAMLVRAAVARLLARADR